MNEFLCWLGLHRTEKRMIKWRIGPDSPVEMDYCTRGNHVVYPKPKH